MAIEVRQSAAALSAEALAAGRHAGLDAIGITTAHPLLRTRRHLLERRARGLHGGMAFTYRNPQRSTDPTATLPGAESIVVGAMSYWRSEPPHPAAPTAAQSQSPVARVARYAWTDPYGPLRAALDEVADVLRRAGHRSTVVADDNALVDREVAVRAGLGWYGKNANVLLPGRGSWFVLGSVITRAPLEASTAAVEDGCGLCSRCIAGCPTGAIIAPGVVDARRCLAWLLQAPGDFPPEFREALGDRLYGCDDCQDVCPINRVATRQRDAPTAEPDARTHVDPLAWLALDDAALLAAAGHWYVPRRDPRYLRRNALVVLGNTGDGTDSETVTALHRALVDPDPLVRTHAVWAAKRLGREDLVHEDVVRGT